MKDRLPLPSVFNTWLLLPLAVGNVITWLGSVPTFILNVPFTFKLSFTVVSDVVCPIDIATPLSSAPIVIADPSIVTAPAASISKVEADNIDVNPSDEIFKIPASISTIDPTLEFASKWKEVPATCSVFIVISLAFPAAKIFIAPELSKSRVTASISKLPDPS